MGSRASDDATTVASQPGDDAAGRQAPGADGAPGGALGSKRGATPSAPPVEDLARRAGERYELRERLGRGGMGDVVRAHDKLLGREVALKFVGAGGTWSAPTREHFLREGRALAALDHPSVVRVYDVDPGRAMLVLELVRGESLADRLRRAGALARDEGVAVCVAVLDGLSAAHRAGVVHRDLKPGNILLGGRGAAARLVDFGIAHLRGADATGGGEIVGTPGYMAPEILAGRSSGDARSDLYAFGVVAYEAFTGRRHRGGRRDRDAAADVRAATGDDALASLVARCLAERPEDRPADADEAAAAFRALAPAAAGGDSGRRAALRASRGGDRTPTPAEVTAPTVAVTTRAWRPRRAGAAAAVGLCALALLAALAVARRAPHGPRAAARGAATAPSAESEVPVPIPLSSAAPEPRRRTLLRVLRDFYDLDQAAAEASLNALVTSDPQWADAQYYNALLRGLNVRGPHAQATLADAALRLPQPEPRRAVLEALRAFERGQFDEALAALDAARRTHPNHWELVYVRAEALTHGDRYEEGYREFNRVLELCPRFLPASFHAIEYALATGDGAALERWSAALDRVERGRDRATATRMWWRIGQGDLRGALALAHEAFAPEVSDARVAALALAGDFDAAREEVIARIADPRRRPSTVADDRSVMAWLAFAQGRRDESERWMAQAREALQGARPNQVVALHGEQALAYAMSGQPARARAALARAVAAAPDPAASRVIIMARALVAWVTRRASALPDLRERHPNDVTPVPLAVAAALAGRHAEALALLERGLGDLSDTRNMAAMEWLAVQLARAVGDGAAEARNCARLARPRRVWSSWAYARVTCPR